MFLSQVLVEHGHLLELPRAIGHGARVAVRSWHCILVLKCKGQDTKTMQSDICCGRLIGW